MTTPILKRVTRLDSVAVNQTFYTEEGYLKDRPVLTSTGIFEYANPDGSIRRELRLPEDVFSPESLASYEGKPIIITHDAGLVTKDNVHEHQVGTILSDGYRSGDDVKAKIIIHDTTEMKRCGLKELSLGYNLDLEEEPGEWNGQRYDAIQRNIRINHLALVREARAGEQARLNIDSKDGETLRGGKLMSKFRTATRSDEALSPEELQKAIEWYKANRDTIENQDGEEEPEVKEKVAPIREAHPVEAEKPVAEPVEKAVTEPNVEKAPEVKAPEKREPDVDKVIAPEDAKPKFGKDAEEVIKDQDKDIKTLLDIIDTLLAEKEFDEADVPNDEEVENEEPVEEPAEEPVEEEQPYQEDSCDDELNEDEDEEIVEAEEELLQEDEDDEEKVDLLAEEEKVLNTDGIDALVSEKIKLGMIGRSLNLDGLENEKIMDAKCAIIKAVRPSVRLDGKSVAYVNAMFDCAVDDMKKNGRGTEYQRRQMFNKDSANNYTDTDSSIAARQRMIDRQTKRGEN